MESSIDIRSLVKSVIMEEVTNLGVRAVVRAKIEEVGELDKQSISQLVETVVDSYVRSVDIDTIIRNKVDAEVSRQISNKVSAALSDYIEGRIFSSKISKHLEELILNDLKSQFYSKYSLEVINRKGS